MAVNINTFKIFVEFVANKVQQGNSFKISEYNDLCNRAQMQLYEKDFETFLQSEQISNFLKIFLTAKIDTIPPDGVYTPPTNEQHISSIRQYYVRDNGKGFNVEVKKMKNIAWSDIQTPGLHEATLRFPKYEEFGTILKFMPRNIGIVEIDYFRIPIKPIWNFTTANSRPVYNPTGSIDFEWSEYSMNQVAANFLSLIGCNLKDRELTQFAEMYKQQTNSVL